MQVSVETELNLLAEWTSVRLSESHAASVLRSMTKLLVR